MRWKARLMGGFGRPVNCSRDRPVHFKGTGEPYGAILRFHDTEVTRENRRVQSAARGSSMPQQDLPISESSKFLTPAGGMVLSVAVSGLLWSGVAVVVHLAGGL
ncbi:hypothetical protein [Sphingomonas bacterium]|uniref:hypothetical protein n=1 Tax=Sphingomonas bacterium TaxID=1895847 RepID=UPI0015750697|nr:hypothetical protein [Sphingomonas bacterium]